MRQFLLVSIHELWVSCLQNKSNLEIRRDSGELPRERQKKSRAMTQKEGNGKGVQEVPRFDSTLQGKAEKARCTTAAFFCAVK